jgi:hypothetical protein
MWMHFDTAELAKSHLTQNGWRSVKTGAWVSRDGTCRATIHPAHGAVVAIRVTEIDRRARQMNAELPEATRDVLKLKGMI